MAYDAEHMTSGFVAICVVFNDRFNLAALTLCPTGKLAGCPLLPTRSQIEIRQVRHAQLAVDEAYYHLEGTHMPDQARMECIGMALKMARSGDFGDTADIETAMIMYHPSKAHICLKERPVMAQLNRLCTIATAKRKSIEALAL